MEDFIIRALIVGILIASVSGQLGCFIVWKKMAFFGDSMAHSALLGVVLGLSWQFNHYLTTMFICLFFVLLLLWFEHFKILAVDSILGILAHFSMAIGIILVSFIPNANIDIHALLFGDILTVGVENIVITATIVGIIAILLTIYWKNFLLIVIQQDIAQAEGINVFYHNVLFMLLISSLVAVAIQIVGVLLITSMLIIPAAGARFLSNTPKQMSIISVILSYLGIVIGLLLSSQWDIPTGPSIVTVFVALFLLINIWKMIKAT